MALEHFEELECYQAARICRREASQFAKQLPAEEKYRLKDQIIRSSLSVTANIAEGFGRHHHQENLQYCRQVRGSLYETVDHYHVALDEAYITPSIHVQRIEEIHTAIKILNGYIRYITNCSTKR